MMQSEVPGVSSHTARGGSASLPRSVTHKPLHAPLPGSALASATAVWSTPPERDQGEKEFLWRAAQAWLVLSLFSRLVHEVWAASYAMGCCGWNFHSSGDSGVCGGSSLPAPACSVLHLHLSMHRQLMVPQVSMLSTPSLFISHFKIRKSCKKATRYIKLQ